VFDNAGADRKYAEAFAASGLGEVDDDEEVVAERVANSAIREPLVAALDDWAHVAREQSRRVWVLGVARRADPHPWRDRLRDPALWQDEKRLARLAAQAPPSALTPNLAAALGNRLTRRKEGQALLLAAQQRYPGDFWLNLNLGNSLMLRGNPQEAEGYFRAALAIRPDSPSRTTTWAGRWGGWGSGWTRRPCSARLSSWTPPTSWPTPTSARCCCSGEGWRRRSG
jgi:serine/threonine-protein kinase